MQYPLLPKPNPGTGHLAGTTPRGLAANLIWVFLGAKQPRPCAQDRSPTWAPLFRAPSYLGRVMVRCSHLSYGGGGTRAFKREGHRQQAMPHGPSIAGTQWCAPQVPAVGTLSIAHAHRRMHTQSAQMSRANPLTFFEPHQQAYSTLRIVVPWSNLFTSVGQPKFDHHDQIAPLISYLICCSMQITNAHHPWPHF